MNLRSELPSKTVIFDLGRVLIHYDHQATLDGLAAISQMSADELHALTDGAFGDRLGRGEMSAQDLHQFLIEKAGTCGDFDAFIEGYTTGIRRDEEALAYAASLTNRPGVQIGIISNTNEAHAIWLHANLPELNQFAHVTLSNEIGLIKPDPRIFRQALQALKIDPINALFVDDLAENVNGAQALGMASIVHTDWMTSRPQLEQWLAQ